MKATVVRDNQQQTLAVDKYMGEVAYYTTGCKRGKAYGTEHNLITMAPGEDVERGRADSAAERQKSIVSMSEFEGMDEYTALQKYILFYRDPKSAG